MLYENRHSVGIRVRVRECDPRNRRRDEGGVEGVGSLGTGPVFDIQERYPEQRAVQFP